MTIIKNVDFCLIFLFADRKLKSYLGNRKET